MAIMSRRNWYRFEGALGLAQGQVMFLSLVTLLSHRPLRPIIPFDNSTGSVRKRPTSSLVELGFFSDLSLVRLAGGRVLDSAIGGLGHSVEQSQCSPEIEHTEDQSNHDDVPSTVSHGPGSQKQLGNSVKSGADGDVFEHKQTMGQQEQSAGDATHHYLPVL